MPKGVKQTHVLISFLIFILIPWSSNLLHLYLHLNKLVCKQKPVEQYADISLVYIWFFKTVRCIALEKTIAVFAKRPIINN